VSKVSSITALILTYNEEKNIRECLESVEWVNEIIVVDSYSEDMTVKIAGDYTSQIYQRRFDDFSAQRNFGLDKATSEWILVVDADERVTPELKEEIDRHLRSNRGEYTGYRIPRKNYFLGKWIKYCGWYPDYVIRLFKKADNRYSGLVHEAIQIKGRVSKLENAFIHYTYRDLEHYLNKINQYTTLDARGKFQAGKKKSLAYILLRPLLEFIKKYIFKRGFLLGKQGLFLALISAFYQFQKYVKLWELHEIKPGREK
jgi:glycosyltransferase involved in cell wall biosynthesis